MANVCVAHVLPDTSPASRSTLPLNPAGARSWLLAALLCILGSVVAHAQVTGVWVQSPSLAANGTAELTSPIHVEATAEDKLTITGYVVYVDYENVYRNFSPSLDAWIAVPPGYHTFYVKAWDSQSNLETPHYQINITGFAPPNPPANAHRISNFSHSGWVADNNPGVGGLCNDGEIGTFTSRSDPNLINIPFAESGQHFIVNSHCAYDDGLFYRKVSEDASILAGATNFIWDFWFYIPTTVATGAVQALEFDLFDTVQLRDGVHEFMFGSQCNYITDQWQFWLPRGNSLTWVEGGISPCRFSTGLWHHATYFFQRVTPSGYQEIPNTFGPSTDSNTSLRFGTLTVDGETRYLGGIAWSTIPNPPWSPVLGVQHQLDSAVAGVTIEEYVGGESLTFW